LARRGHPADDASKSDCPTETVNLIDTLTKLVERPDDLTAEAPRHAVESFLRDYVFRGLNALKPPCDSQLIAHFRAVDFFGSSLDAIFSASISTGLRCSVPEVN
jgi:hypothetical protein